jgi:hypothetical protein
MKRDAVILQLSPMVINSGFAGMVALVFALAWLTILQAPAFVGRLVAQ